MILITVGIEVDNNDDNKAFCTGPRLISVEIQYPGNAGYLNSNSLCSIRINIIIIRTIIINNITNNPAFYSRLRLKIL